MVWNTTPRGSRGKIFSLKIQCFSLTRASPYGIEYARPETVRGPSVGPRCENLAAQSCGFAPPQFVGAYSPAGLLPVSILFWRCGFLGQSRESVRNGAPPARDAHPVRVWLPAPALLHGEVGHEASPVIFKITVSAARHLRVRLPPSPSPHKPTTQNPGHFHNHSLTHHRTSGG
jgi:hypothetical protein